MQKCARTVLPWDGARRRSAQWCLGGLWYSLVFLVSALKRPSGISSVRVSSMPYVNGLVSGANSCFPACLRKVIWGAGAASGQAHAHGTDVATRGARPQGWGSQSSTGVTEACGCPRDQVKPARSHGGLWGSVGLPPLPCGLVEKGIARKWQAGG